MKKPAAKIIVILFLIVFSVGAWQKTTKAQSIAPPDAWGCTSMTDAKGTVINYCALAPIPIPNNSGTYDVTKGVVVFTGFGSYLANFIKLFMGIVGVLAVLMIIIGGIEYMSTVSLDEKSGARTRITNALLGLVLALSSYVILFTINPALTEFDIHLPGVILKMTDTSISVTTATQGQIPTGIAAAALAYKGSDTSGGPPSTECGNKACAWAVNNVLGSAGVAKLGDGVSVQSMEDALKSGRGTLVDQSHAVAGDIVIQAADKHVGICLDDGCTQVLSNSSPKATFSTIDNISFSKSYSDGPGRIYHVNN